MQVTFEVLWGTILLVGMTITGITSVLTLREKIKAARKPHDDHMAQVDEHERLLGKDYRHLIEVDNQLKGIAEQVGELQRSFEEFDTLNKIQTSAIQALLHHEITGNDVHKLETEQAFIDRYLHPEKYDLGIRHET